MRQYLMLEKIYLTMHEPYSFWLKGQVNNAVKMMLSLGERE